MNAVEEHAGRRPSSRGVEEVDDVLAEPGRGEAHQLDVVARRRLVGDERVRGVDAELRLARAGGRAAPQPGELLAQEVVAAVGDDAGHPLALGLGEDVGGVAALVLLDRPAVDLPRLRRDGVEEPPVVGDDDEAGVRAREGSREVLGQPGDALDVEVVGRLVEEQQVGRGDEQRGQRDPAALAPRERPDGRREPADDRGVEPAEQPDEDVADPRVGRPTRARPCPPRTASWTVASGSRVSSWVSTPMRSAAGARHPAVVGLRLPARTRSSVVLPPPLRPTTPMRSPPFTPRETASSTCVVPRAREARSTETRLATSRPGGG